MAYAKQKRIFFDLETLANKEALSLMPEPKAPGNLKDPEKIRIAIEEKRAELIETAALDPDYGKILSIGFSFGEGFPVFVRTAYDRVCTDWDEEGNEIEFRQVTEAEMITEFWQNFKDCQGNCVGYNVLGFDLPYLLRRSMALNVKVPLIPNMAKFRTEPVTDLVAILYNWGGMTYKGLKQVAKIYGIPNDCEGVDGSKVATLTPDELRAYAVSDVKLTIALYNRMNGVYFNH